MIGKYNNSFFNCKILYIYLFIITSEFLFLAFQFIKPTIIPVGIRIIQFALPLIFLCFFELSIYYHEKNISFILILSFQIICSLLLWGYYYFCTGQPLGYDANDALAYQQALEKSLGQSWNYLIEVLKQQPRTASVSDWGFPTYRFFIYKIFPNITDGILALVIINSIIHSISSIYVYKLSTRFLNQYSSIIVMSLWGLSATSVHINTCGLKETIFSFFVIVAVYHMVEIKYSKNKIHFFMFLFNVFLIWFFRNYISIFLILVYFGCYPCRKIFYKRINLFVVGIFLIAFLGMDILAKFLPELSFVKYTRDKRLTEFFGSKGIIANTMNFCFAWVAPIPRFNYSAQIKQVIISGYSIFSTFFSPFGFYGLFIVLKKKLTSFYPLIVFLICNIVLVIITCNSLDFRFQHPTSFIYDILIILGFSEIAENGIRINFGKPFKMTLSLNIMAAIIFSIMFVIMFVYNRR